MDNVGSQGEQLIQVMPEQVAAIQNMMVALLGSYANRKKPPANEELCKDVIALLTEKSNLSQEALEGIKNTILSTLEANAQYMTESAVTDRINVIAENPDSTQMTAEDVETAYPKINLMVRAALAVAVGGAAFWFAGPYCAFAARGLYATTYGALFGIPNWYNSAYWVSYMPGVEWAANVGFTWGHGLVTTLGTGAGLAGQEIIDGVLSGTGFVIQKTKDGVCYVADVANTAGTGVGNLYARTTYALDNTDYAADQFEAKPVNINESLEDAPELISLDSDNEEIEEEWVNLIKVEHESVEEVSKDIMSHQFVAPTQDKAQESAPVSVGWFEAISNYFYPPEKPVGQIPSASQQAADSLAPPYVPALEDKRSVLETRDDIDVNRKRPAEDKPMLQRRKSESDLSKVDPSPVKLKK